MQLFPFKKICSQQNKPSYLYGIFLFWDGLLSVKDLTSVWAVCNPCHWRSAVAHLTFLLMKISHYWQKRQEFDHRTYLKDVEEGHV